MPWSSLERYDTPMFENVELCPSCPTEAFCTRIVFNRGILLLVEDSALVEPRTLEHLLCASWYLWARMLRSSPLFGVSLILDEKS